MESIGILIFVVLLLVGYTSAAGNPAGHGPRFRRRRLANWLPLGLTYAFLYMARYNLTVSKNALEGLMSKEDFGIIFGAGTITYALAFLINGPLTDRIGGKRAILLSSIGSATMNVALGIITYLILSRPDLHLNLTLIFSLAYSVNMYFQSYGAVAIVKVNSNWFHVRERGSFGGVFGVLISLGVYFAFDWGRAVVDATRVQPVEALSLSQQWLRSLAGADGTSIDQTWWVFFVPAVVLYAFAAVDWVVLRDRPSQAGFEDFDTADASSGEADGPFSLTGVLKKVLSMPVIWVIGSIEFCSGVLRNGVMHWYPIFIKERGLTQTVFFAKHWGKVLCAAGITGGMAAGFISDKVFGSRRGPVAALLYLMLVICSVLMAFALQSSNFLGSLVAVMSLAVIGVHGMLSGTATMDFGGRKAAGTAVAVIDGFVYLGTGLQSLALGAITTYNWQYWPVFMVPFAIFGLVQAVRIWAAYPQPARRAAH